MYKITINGKSETVEELRYVRFSKITNCWIRTKEKNAEAIAVDGELYNLEGKKPIQVTVYTGIGEPDEFGRYEEYKEELITPPICYIVKL